MHQNISSAWPADLQIICTMDKDPGKCALHNQLATLDVQPGQGVSQSMTGFSSWS